MLKGHVAFIVRVEVGQGGQVAHYIQSLWVERVIWDGSSLSEPVVDEVRVSHGAPWGLQREVTPAGLGDLGGCI